MSSRQTVEPNRPCHARHVESSRGGGIACLGHNSNMLKGRTSPIPNSAMESLSVRSGHDVTARTAYCRALWCYPSYHCCVIYGEGFAPNASMRGCTYSFCLSEEWEDCGYSRISYEWMRLLHRQTNQGAKGLHDLMKGVNVVVWSLQVRVVGGAIRSSTSRTSR